MIVGESLSRLLDLASGGMPYILIVNLSLSLKSHDYQQLDGVPLLMGVELYIYRDKAKKLKTFSHHTSVLSNKKEASTVHS